jgi:signal transduction histidine kinase
MSISAPPAAPLRSLYAKLALMLMVVFGVVAGLIVFGAESMINPKRAIELGTALAVGAVAFSLLASLIVFNVLTRRLRQLAADMDEFCTTHLPGPPGVPMPGGNSDEIDRLAIAFRELSARVTSQFRQLEASDQQRRELLANVSHDLRTPLASMQGYLEMLLLKRGALSPEEERSYLEVATKHCERLSKLVRDLFDLTKLEANEVRLDAEVFPLSELVQDVGQKFQLSAERRGIILQTRVIDPVPPARVDIGKMERVLENLIENALRHTPAGGVIRIVLAAAGGRVRLEVSDTGHGIAPENLDAVFERYYRVNRGEEGDASNAGLGLAISKRIVALHGGNLRVTSKLGVGTTFFFDLPAG